MFALTPSIQKKTCVTCLASKSAAVSLNMIDHALKLRFCPVRYAVFQVLLQSAFQPFYINLEERLNRLGQRSGTAVKVEMTPPSVTPI